MLHAVNCHIEQIKNTLKHIGKKYYAVFIDYSKAFDLLNREILIQKLRNMIRSEGYNKHSELQFYSHTRRGRLVKENHTDKWSITRGPNQPSVIQHHDNRHHRHAMLMMYADDMVIGSADKEEVQHILSKLKRWAEENSLQINHKWPSGRVESYHDMTI